MAVVFRARDERLHRLVALKVLGPAMAADEDFRRRFIRESRAAAAVEDPHIIPVHEAGEADGVLFIAMRYVPGGDVRTLVRQAGTLPPAQAAAIISPVASALDSAHAAGLVHRDVKPANMLLDVRPGRPDHVYLSDFGLSKGVLSLGLTRSGHFLGTPGYSAPEQIQGRPVDGRADQYALACTAFELLSGAAVFPRDEVIAVMYAHLSEPPPRLTNRRPGTPDAADAVFARALAKEPARRYGSCREFADALRGAFGLLPYDAAHETGPQLDHPPAAITPLGAFSPGDGAPTQSAALAASQPASRKAVLTRRTILGLAAATAAGAAAAGWDLSHQTAAPRHHTTTTTAPRRPPGGTPIWTTTIPNNGIGWGPVVAGGIIYLGDAGRLTRLYAVRMSDGQTLWHHRGAVQGSLPGGSNVAITKETIYSLTYNGGRALGVAAYNTRTGATKWVLPADINVGEFNGPIITGGVLYLTDVPGTLYALNPASGRALWTYPPLAIPGNLVAASNGTAYLTSMEDSTWDSEGSLYAIRSGRQVWRFTSRGMNVTVPKTIGDRIFIMTYSGNIYALRTETGREIWHFNVGTLPVGALLADDMIYISDKNGKIHGLRVSDGKEVWHSPSITASSRKFNLVTGNNTVYVSNDYGDVYAFRANDGTRIWRASIGGLDSALAINQNTVYVGSDKLYALRAADGKQLWDFPVKALSLAATPHALYANAGRKLYALRP
jgi:serine/threonine-protein kinase